MMRKMPVALTLAIITIFSVFSVAFGYFPDIENSWAKDTIKKWQDKGFALGYEDGKFHPDNQVTRAEFSAFTNRYFGLKNKGDGTEPFVDVKETDWFVGDVVVANTYGYINGYKDTVTGNRYFKPNDKITREDVAVIIYNILHMNANDPCYANALTTIKDADAISPYAKDAVKAIIGEKFMKGYEDQTFRPKGYLTRAEAITILDNISTLYPDTYHAGDKGTDVQLVVTAGQAVTIVESEAQPGHTEVFVAGKAGGASYMVNAETGFGAAKTDVWSFVKQYCPTIPVPPILP